MKKIRLTLTDEEYNFFSEISEMVPENDECHNDIRKTIIQLAKFGHDYLTVGMKYFEGKE